jgi:hypothetical protein
MRKITLCLIASMACLFTAAQQDTTLVQYIGKYVFKEGSAVPDMTVTLNENGVLIASSVQGSSELKKTEGDVFQIVAYNGLATFKRNDTGKVNWVKVEVGDIVLEGTRSENYHFSYSPYLHKTER